MAILKKIRDKIKGVITKTRDSKLIKSIPARFKAKSLLKKKEPVQDPKREVMGSHETLVGQAKFYSPQAKAQTARFVKDLPAGYGNVRIVAMVRDPWWIHTYWEITQDTWDNLKSRLKENFSSAKLVLRVYDVTNVMFNGRNAHRFFDVELGYGANSWYIDTGGPGRAWCVDIGLRLANGEFILIARSNVVSTPLDGPSWITDEEWMIPEEMFARLYGMGFGFGRSSPLGKAWQERMRRALFSGILASPGMASMASPVKKQAPKQRKFWMWVNTELIVYGATEPDAKVTVQGKTITLRPDGTFSLRFALPDGKQVIPVEATSSDEIDTITITPIVEKDTKHNSVTRQTTGA
ncbi:MAG: DUF4912 domain-containing protein [Candidatus Omnitrophica bacterium]|jgi:hypothetical protein|nr:DUF4912 domain-containing protein [Candidatus Omnitrophota bacterium]